MTTQTVLSPGQIIRQHQQAAPVDVLAIARDLGINVLEMHDLPARISRKIFRDALSGGSSGYVIAVRSGDGFCRKRLSVAHEIAHFILHRDKIGGELVDDEVSHCGLSSREESRANRLADDIIMPVDLINALRKEGLDVFALADALQVSEDDIRARFSYL